MDKRLSFGRIVEKKVIINETGEIGICEYWDKIEKVFLISLNSYKNKFNPEGFCTCIRDDFEII